MAGAQKLRSYIRQWKSEGVCHNGKQAMTTYLKEELLCSDFQGFGSSSFEVLCSARKFEGRGKLAVSKESEVSRKMELFFLLLTFLTDIGHCVNASLIADNG